MRVLLVNYEYPPFGGGAGNATRELGQSLVRMGHEVLAITGGQDEPYTEPSGVQVTPLGSPRKHHSHATFVEMFLFVLRAVFWVLRKRAQHFDLSIVFFAIPCGPVGTCLNKRWGIPYIVSLRGGDVPGLVPEIKLLHWFLAPFRRWVNKNALSVVANSLSLAELAQAADPVCVSVIPNGVDTQYYHPSGDRVGRKDAPLQLLLVGRFHRQKRIPETLRCLAEAKREGVNFFTTIVGDGPESGAIRSVVEEFDMSKSITVKGWLNKEELRREYQQADCYLNCSSYEGMPNTVLEAMSCGLPVIASDIPPHRNLVKDQVTGYLVDLGRPENLIDQLAALAADSRRGRVMGEAARELVLADHSWTAVANSYLTLFSQHSKKSANHIV